MNSPHETLDACRVNHPIEVASLLRCLRDREAPIVLATPAGISMAGTLWSLDEAAGRLHLGVNEHAPQLQALVAADEAVGLSTLDSIQLQFELQSLVLVRGASDCTLQADWPSSLLRVQRRETYRVRPAGSSLAAARAAPTLRMRHPALPDMNLALRLLDVSIGGCALLLPPDVPELEPGTRIAIVQVQLDLQTQFEGGLLLHHVNVPGSRDGEAAQPRRIGCSWDALGASAERALQRYILQTQQRQRLRKGA